MIEDSLSLPTAPEAGPSPLAAKWDAVHQAAAVVAGLAGAPPQPCAIEAFPARIDAAGGWRRALADQGIDDLAAVMRPGIAALVAANAAGAAPAAAAQALWREFVRARDAVVALLPEA